MKMQLSMDARVLVAAFFSFGPKASLTVGGRHAESRLTARAANAMNELVANGCVTAEPFNDTGRMTYTGTEKIAELKRLSLARMEKHGDWSPTEPNADRES